MSNGSTLSVAGPFATVLKQKIDFSRKKKRVIVIAGPTGVGKTLISLMIARAIGGEIVSADSMQVYRGMDIGTAKVTPMERGSIRHHLVDSRDLDESFNVVDFYNEALQSFREIFAREHVPIVVGGTGFYIHALLYGPPQGPAPNPEIRQRLEQEIEQQGSLALYERLKNFDPDYAKTITFRDRNKIVRGLEIMELTSQKVSDFEKVNDLEHDFDFRCWFLHIPRDELYNRVEIRCEQMLVKGFVDEVKRLEKEGLRQNKSASQAIGYRQCLSYLASGQTPEDYNQFIKEFKKATRHYVKRQFTWFRNEPLFRWLDVQATGIDVAVEHIIQDYEHGGEK